MLDRDKIAQLIKKKEKQIYPNQKDFYLYFKKAWSGLSFKKSENLTTLSWQNNLCDTNNYMYSLLAYTIISADGSQIYPDRHRSLSTCGLVNIGSCCLSYNYLTRKSSALFNTNPYVYTYKDFQSKFLYPHQDLKSYIDLERQYLELQYGLEHETNCFLLDGNLLFWYLQKESNQIKSYYLQHYIDLLELYYNQKKIIAGYISFPSSRDLVDLLSAYMCSCQEPNQTECICFYADYIYDRDIVSWYLPSLSYSTIFYNQSIIAHEYPEYLRPCFAYINNGIEIARVEFPYWIAQDALLLEQLFAMIFDQCLKGSGYPVVIAQAHEQAVIKSNEQDYFFYLLDYTYRNMTNQSIGSAKSVSKRLVTM